jgi:hypothetical protein
MSPRTFTPKLHTKMGSRELPAFLLALEMIERIIADHRLFVVLESKAAGKGEIPAKFEVRSCISFFAIRTS